MDIGSTVRLANGVEMPRLGLGVFRAEPGRETYAAVLEALRVGYRHVDTARLYGNEADVGRAVRDSGLRREAVFVTTKLWNADHGYDRAIRAFHGSLEALGLGYVDLYLIHWPVEGLRGESWRALETLLGEGLCRAIGVSNYTRRHLEELLSSARVAPAANQVEFSPFLVQRELLEFCGAHGIVLEAYSPLTKGKRLNHPLVASVGRRHGKRPAQVLIRWALQHGTAVLPKSTNPAHIRQNAEVFDFELARDEIQALDGLHEDLHTGWDPARVP